jgi:hypothetical protein
MGWRERKRTHRIGVLSCPKGVGYRRRTSRVNPAFVGGTLQRPGVTADNAASGRPSQQGVCRRKKHWALDGEVAEAPPPTACACHPSQGAAHGHWRTALALLRTGRNRKPGAQRSLPGFEKQSPIPTC